MLTEKSKDLTTSYDAGSLVLKKRRRTAFEYCDCMSKSLEYYAREKAAKRTALGSSC